MIRVLIADDHHLVRQGIRALLEKAEDIDVVAEASDGQEAVMLVERLQPDVAVLDIAMPRLNGTQAIQKIQAAGIPTRMVVLSMYSDETLVQQALRLGAKGYLLKRSVTEELLLAIRAAHRGEMFLSSAVSGNLLNNLFNRNGAEDAQNQLQQLTPREVEVLQLIAEGRTNSAIAEAINVSVKTVEKHRASLMDKLNVHDTAGLVKVALRHRLIFLDE